MTINAVGASTPSIPNNYNQKSPVKPTGVRASSAPASVVERVPTPSLNDNDARHRVFRAEQENQPASKAVGAYLAVQNNERRDQVSSMLGLDVYV